MSQIVDSAKPKFEKVLEHLKSELSSIRTGRANSALVENIQVDLYGQQQPLKHIANITVSDPKTIMISPWDPNSLKPIENSIQEDSSLGLNPRNDGQNLYVPIPEMTTERRQQVVKQLNEMAEEAHVSVRNIRHQVLSDLRKAEDDGDISEDELHRAEEKLQEQVDSYNDQIDERAEAKKEEIMKV